MTVRTENDDNNSQDVPQEMETANEDVEANSYDSFHKTIDEILSKKSFLAVDYDIIKEIAQQNPLAIEGKLHEIFKKILLDEKNAEPERNSYEELMSAIIDACIRLKRLPKIVSWILMALKERLTNRKFLGKLSKKKIFILPQQFTERFSASIANLTNSQVGNVLTSLIYHFDSLLVNSMEEKMKESLAMPFEALVIFSEVIGQITAAFLEGVDLFGATRQLVAKQKFVKGLKNLGETVSKLMTFLQSESEDDGHQMVSLNLWKILEVWITVVAFVNHHAPDAIVANDWDDILHRIADMKDSNKFEGYGHIEKGTIYSNIKENIQQIQSTWKSCTDQDVEHKNNEDPDLEQFWNVLVDKYPKAIHRLSDESICHLAKLLIENLNEVTEVLVIDSIQNNENLMAALIFEIFRKIHAILENTGSTTEGLLGAINKMNWWKNGERHKLKILKSLRTLLTSTEWTTLKHKKVAPDIIPYLKVLLRLPLMYCSTDLKTVVFLMILSLRKETSDDVIVASLCEEILSTTLERYKGDLLGYIQPEILIQELSECQHLLSTVIERSLINPSNYELLKQALKSNIENKNIPVIMLECIDKMKVKNREDKELLKFEKKLVKKILLDVNEVSLNINQLKALTAALKIAVALKKVNDDLMNKIRVTLEILIGKTDTVTDINSIEFTKESYNFIKVVLQCRDKGVSIDRPTMRNIWKLVMTKSSSDIVLILIEASDAKTLTHVLNLLRKNTLKALEKNDEKSLENLSIIWNVLAEVKMDTSREKIRQLSLQGLMQSMRSVKALNDNVMLNTMKLFVTVMSSKRMAVTDKTIDLIIAIVNSFLNSSATLAVAQRTLDLCSSCLKFRPGIAVDYLSIILRLYLRALKITVEVAKKSSAEEHLQCLIMLEIQKLASAFVKMKTHTAKLSPYIIADMVALSYGGGVVPNYIKEPLDDSISQFLGICDPHAISLLFRVLSPSMQEIFKNIYDNYIKFHKFSGKV
ncbi:uncharacterized protein LOC135164754 isoform X2 [Diachasmimorpha longicaudata]|uniref:uncharacterized protein LOC135164754 isoform X2 n=1 Tax=Diachasmimorpha longicaudata TaxID=58733 RepID=UPI0030B89DC9